MPKTIVPLSRTQPAHDSEELVPRTSYQAIYPNLMAKTARCVYIHGPAGYGKSGMLTQLYRDISEQGESQTAWLSLSSDQEGVRSFIPALAQSLQRNCQGLGAGSDALMSASDKLELSVLTGVLGNELFSHPKAVAVFIDGFEHINDPAAETFLASLLLNSHPEFRILIAGRGDFPARFESLRSKGIAYSIGPEALRLNLQETLHYLNKVHDIPAASDQASVFMQASDAWPLALNMYASRYKTNTGRTRLALDVDSIMPDVFSYFETEIMPGVDADLRKRLIEVSLCNTIDPDFVNELYDDGPSFIDQLTLLNLFLRPFGNSNNFRYHKLFHEFLRSKQSTIPLRRRKQIHQQASLWFLNQNNYVEAIYHALAVSDWETAIYAIDNHRLEIMTHNQLPLVWQWLSAIPQSVVNQHPRLLLMLSWHHAIERNPRTSIQYLSSIKEKDRGALALSEDHDVHIELAALQSVIIVNQGLYSEMMQLCKDSTKHNLNDNRIFNNVYTAALVYAFTQLGELDTAHRLAVRIEHFRFESNVLSSIYRFVFRGLAYRSACQLDAAEAQHLRAISIAQDMLGDEDARFSVPEAMLLEIYYLKDEWHLADQYRPQCERLERESVSAEPVIAAYGTLARLAFANNQHDKALDHLAQGESYGKTKSCDKTIAHMLALRCFFLLQLGDTGSAESLLTELKELDQLSPNNAMVESHGLWSDVGFCRVIAATYVEQSKKALKHSPAQLSQYAVHARKNRRHFELLQIHLLEAINYDIEGKRQTARKKMVQVLEQAAGSNIIRLFLDNGNIALELLTDVLRHWDSVKQHLEQGIDEEFITKLKHKLQIPDVKTLTGDIDKLAADTLNARDIALLGYIGDGLKNRDIAEAMSLSENTIAWHLKNLYAKLNAKNRTSAVSQARKLKLID